MTEDHHGSEETGIWARSTAPQSAYGSREVAIGAAVAAIGLLVVFGVPLALT